MGRLHTQHLAQLPREFIARIGLGDELDTVVKMSIVNHGTIGIARGEKDREPW
jgi:hypothetical protein